MVGWVIKSKESKTMKKFPRGTILKLTCDVYEFLAKAPKAYEDLIDVIDSKGKVKVKTHNGDYVGLYGMKAKIHTRFMKHFVDVTPEIEVDKASDNDVAWTVFDSCELNDKGERMTLNKVVTKKEAEVFVEHEDAKVIIEQRKKEVKEKHAKPELAQKESSLIGEGTKWCEAADIQPNISANDFERGMINAMKDIARLCGYQFAVDVGYEDIAEKVSASMSINKALLIETTDSLAKAASKLNSLGYEFGYGEWLNREEIKKCKASELKCKINSLTIDDFLVWLNINNIEL